MVKATLLLALLSAVASGCATSHSAVDHESVRVDGAHSSIVISPVSPWSYSREAKPSDGRLCLTPAKLAQMPTATINFEFMPEGTDVSRLLLQQPWIGSEPAGKSSVKIGTATYPLFHRDGELTELSFCVIPLQGEVLVASLTIAKGFEQYIPQFRSDLEHMLATLEIRPETI